VKDAIAPALTELQMIVRQQSNPIAFSIDEANTNEQMT
jgi:hypothetical protein